MTEAQDTSTKPRGLFDRRSKGLRVTSVNVQVERGRVRFFTQTLGETDPIHLDAEAARAAGHPDVVAPPSFFMVLEAIANETLLARGEPSARELIACDYRYLLHGDESYAYHGLLYAGDEVEISTTVLDFFEKKGGAMEFVALESTVTHPTRGRLISARRTLLHRLPE